MNNQNNQGQQNQQGAGAKATSRAARQAWSAEPEIGSRWPEWSARRPRSKQVLKSTVRFGGRFLFVKIDVGSSREVFQLSGRKWHLKVGIFQ